MKCEHLKIKESHNIYSPMLVEATTDLGNHYYESGIPKDTFTVFVVFKVCESVSSALDESNLNRALKCVLSSVGYVRTENFG